MLQSARFFKDLPPPMLSRVAGRCRRRRLGRDEVLFQKGDPADALYAVSSGQVGIHASMADGRDLLLEIMQPGDVFGETTLLDGVPRTANATALESTEILVLRRAEILDLLRSDGDLALHLLRLTSQRLRRMSAMVEETALLPAEARLARRILDLLASHGTDGASPRELRLPQRAIGELAGLSRETANKYLRRWSQQGWIAIRRGSLIVHDLVSLRGVADGDEMAHG